VAERAIGGGCFGWDTTQSFPKYMRLESFSPSSTTLEKSSDHRREKKIKCALECKDFEIAVLVSQKTFILQKKYGCGCIVVCQKTFNVLRKLLSYICYKK